MTRPTSAANTPGDASADAVATLSANAGASTAAQPQQSTAPQLRVAASRERAAAEQALLVKRQATVLQTVVDLLEEPTLHTSLHSLTGELCRRFKCDRVAIGMLQNRDVQIKAISQHGAFDPTTQENRALAEAMLEAIDHDAPIHYTGLQALEFKQGKHNREVTSIASDSHAELAGKAPDKEIFTIALCHAERAYGALCFQRTSAAPWQPNTLKLFSQITAVVAPLLALRADAERSSMSRLRRDTRRSLEWLFGRRFVGAKLLGSLAAAVLTASLFLTTDFRVTAAGELRPIEHRVISAPMDGFIRDTFVAPGDLVTEGDRMLTLDTADLTLEQQRWQGEVESAGTALRVAMAGRDRSEVAIAKASLDQARAELALVEQRLGRANIVAPRDGIVVSGDLSQSLGAPVQRGEALLEIAPDKNYQAILQVSEMYVGYLQPGSTGTFVSRASPDQELSLRVTAIHPIAEGFEGTNSFRVEADLLDAPQDLRPGHTGVAKIGAGEATVFWVWTHAFTDWLSLKLWSWRP
ncbi:MAG: HlyD family efflux transporter periplasmic adaptor subunit [Pseudomonadota bacterium]